MEDLDRPDVDAPLLRALGAGAALAAAFWWIGPLRRVFSTFATLFHETGHAAAAWLLGRPAIPKFDLQYGGGLTSIEDRSGFVTLFVAAGWAALAWSRRSNRLALGLVLAGAALWAPLAFSRGGEILVLLAGHVGELLLGGIFLWRALTGVSVAHEAERTLYAAVGIFVLVEALLFPLGLLGGGDLRAEYEAGKGGLLPNDFVQVADLLGTRLDPVLLAFLAVALATPVLTVLLWWRGDLLRRAWERARS